MSIEKSATPYSLLSKLLGLKFSRELKDSGIEFGSLYKIQNLITYKEHYMIVVNKVEITFARPRDFQYHFIKFLTANIKSLKAWHTELENTTINIYTDDVGLEMKTKEVENFIYQQNLLLKKFTEFNIKMDNETV